MRAFWSFGCRVRVRALACDSILFGHRSTKRCQFRFAVGVLGPAWLCWSFVIVRLHVSRADFQITVTLYVFNHLLLSGWSNIDFLQDEQEADQSLGLFSVRAKMVFGHLRHRINASLQTDRVAATANTPAIKRTRTMHSIPVEVVTLSSVLAASFARRNFGRGLEICFPNSFKGCFASFFFPVVLRTICFCLGKDFECTKQLLSTWGVRLQGFLVSR